jgi:hypothetical protein
MCFFEACESFVEDYEVGSSVVADILFNCGVSSSSAQ